MLTGQTANAIGFKPFSPKSTAQFHKEFLVSGSLRFPSLHHVPHATDLSNVEKPTHNRSEANIPGSNADSGSDSAVTVGLMAKFWETGRVKTRLGVSIGMEKSAQLHKLFVVTLSRAIARWSHSCPIQLVAVVTPDKNQSDFHCVIDKNWTTQVQAEGDLGNRMQHWFCQTLQQSSTATQSSTTASGKAILIGADCPRIDSHVMTRATELLDTHELVVGPAIDGGYYLIALRGPWRDEYQTLFADVPWSTDDVLAITQQRASNAGISLALLEPRDDIDTAPSLDRLRAALAECPATDLVSHQLLQQIDSVLAGETGDEKESTL